MSTDGAGTRPSILDDPAFRKLLAQRSRLRWSLTALLSISYLGYGLATLYFPDAMAAAFFDTTMPWVMFLGYLLIGLSIGLSIVYVRVVGRLTSTVKLPMGDD